MRDSTISIVRVLAMLSIILGHVFSWRGINTYQLLSVGVEIFLFISGYLYATKRIESLSAFIKSRAKKLLIPMWIMVWVVGIPTSLVGGGIHVENFLIYVFNLQGLGFVFHSVKALIHGIPGLGQLWFLTVIFVCYFLMYLLKAVKIDLWIDQHIQFSFLLGCILTALLAFFNIAVSYIDIFFVGYFWKRQKNTLCVNHKTYKFITIIMFLMVMTRIGTRRILDDTPFYECFIARVSMCVLAVWLIVSVAITVRKKNNVAEKVVHTKMWLFLDKMSYPLFVTHYAFLTGNFDVARYFEKSFVGIIVFIICTVISAVCLSEITEWINKFEKVIFSK